MSYDELRIVRMKEAVDYTGRGRSSIYNDIAAGLMTKPIAVGANGIGWPLGELRAINKARIAGKTEDEIRALVVSLHAARTA